MMAGSVAGRVRGLALVAGSMAGLFLFGVGYLRHYGIGFGWQSGVLWPDAKPVKYALVTGTIALLAVVTIAAAVWAGVHPDGVARYLAER